MSETPTQDISKVIASTAELVEAASNVARSNGANARDVEWFSDTLTPNLLRAEAVKRQLEAGTLLDRADELEIRAKLREAVLQLDAPFEAALQEEDRLVKAVEAAIQAEREAEDEARDAAENYRLATEAEREGQLRKLSAADETALLTIKRAAADVATRRQATAEGAKTNRESLERRLTAARQEVRDREAACNAASQLAANPPMVPTSAVTALLDGVRRLMWGLPLDETATAVVAELIGAAAGMTGVARQIKAKAVDEHDRELANRAFERNMPAKGHPFRPSNPTSPVFAVRPPTG
ncbi:hypothetical protein [Streptomyces olivochromogenes]|uniref:Chromosome partition protein Smc n=1 Tax=Streptomyces olivochromogenes TaxID=1963 RepID=A0A250VFH6_STROL|nr:hypothetical protein [Streptomyces olivochromogenes]KUN47441.1 hypothetical protein AQJ27_10925 [Streptomyces olivochromogenes]GAX52859.1 hypothetical protein SO3561_04378 [Streptomyces olivochromogenes]